MARCEMNEVKAGNSKNLVLQFRYADLHSCPWNALSLSNRVKAMWDTIGIPRCFYLIPTEIGNVGRTTRARIILRPDLRRLLYP